MRVFVSYGIDSHLAVGVSYFPGWLAAGSGTAPQTPPKAGRRGDRLGRRGGGDAGLSDAPSPHTGRLVDRIRVLRERCVAAMGEQAFTRAYNFLKATAAEAAASAGSDAGGDGASELAGAGGSGGDARVHRGLLSIVGPENIHLWGVLDQVCGSRQPAACAASPGLRGAIFF